MDTAQRRPLLLMTLTILIDFIGFGLILPLLPFWAQKLGANPLGIGLILTIYALAQFIFTPILGRLSDRYGRKPIIFLSLLVEAVSLLLTALASTFPLLLLARFIGGIGASNIGSAQAVVSDVTPASERAKGMGFIGAAIGLGFVIGPAIGGLLAPRGQGLPFRVAAGVAILNAFLVLLFLPETRKRRRGGEREQHLPTLFSGWRNLIGHRTVLRLVCINLLFTIAFTSMEALFPLLSQRLFGWGAQENGYIFTYVGIVVVIMQGGLVARLVKRWNEHILLVAGLILMTIGLVLLPYSTQLVWMLVSLGLLSVGDGAVTPTVSTLLSFASSLESQGETLGLAQGIGGLGRVIGPLLAGEIFTAANPGAPFIVGGILVLLAVLLAWPKLVTHQTGIHEATPSEPASSTGNI